MSGRRGPNRAGATERLRRILAMVPWLAAAGGPTVAEVCARFGITRDELQSDIELLTYHVAIPPYTPDAFFELAIEGGRVFARVTPSLDRPLRLTPAEGLALVVAGRALAGDGDSPLARGLAKIAALLRIDPDDAVAIDLGVADEDVLTVLRRAVAEHRQVAIDHYGEGRGERLVRTVHPWAVTSTAGTWYLIGHDELRDAERSFRVDRIAAVTLLDDAARPPAGEVRAEPGPAEDAPRVVLELTPAGRWVAESYPADEVEELGGGAVRVTLAVNSEAWLASLLLRLGPDGALVDGPSDLLDARAAAARRILARYR